MIRTLSAIVLVMLVLICSGPALATTYYVAFMGDSYGAGEGNPDVQINEAGGLRWADFQCHRSSKNGRIAAINALNAELESSGTRIVAIDVACSGATVNEGLLGSYFGVPVSEAVAEALGFPPGSNAVFSRPKPPQIDEVKTWMQAGGRNLDKLDAVVISVGGNDVGFGTVVGTCLLDIKVGGIVELDCANNRDLESIIQRGVDARGVRKRGVVGFVNIRSEYARLDKAIREDLKPNNLLIIGYPDPLRDQSGQFCHRALRNNSKLRVNLIC